MVGSRPHISEVLPLLQDFRRSHRSSGGSAEFFHGRFESIQVSARVCCDRQSFSKRLFMRCMLSMQGGVLSVQGGVASFLKQSFECHELPLKQSFECHELPFERSMAQQFEAGLQVSRTFACRLMHGEPAGP